MSRLSEPPEPSAFERSIVNSPSSWSNEPFAVIEYCFCVEPSVISIAIDAFMPPAFAVLVAAEAIGSISLVKPHAVNDPASASTATPPRSRLAVTIRVLPGSRMPVTFSFWLVPRDESTPLR